MDIDSVHADIHRQLVEFGPTSAGTSLQVAQVDASAESLLLERLKPLILSDLSCQFSGFLREVGQEANREDARHVQAAPLPRRHGSASHDEELAQANGLPTSADDLASMTLQTFNCILRDYRLNKEQKALARKIRRRGRQKIAARKRRLRRDLMLPSSAISRFGDAYDGSPISQNEEDELAVKSIWSPGSC